MNNQPAPQRRKTTIERYIHKREGDGLECPTVIATLGSIKHHEITGSDGLDHTWVLPEPEDTEELRKVDPGELFVRLPGSEQLYWVTAWEIPAEHEERGAWITPVANVEEIHWHIATDPVYASWTNPEPGRFEIEDGGYTAVAAKDEDCARMEVKKGDEVIRHGHSFANVFDAMSACERAIEQLKKQDSVQHATA